MKVGTHICRVVEHPWVNARYKYLRLACPAPLARSTVAGQFFQLACPVSDNEAPFLRRPMSVYGIGRFVAVNIAVLALITYVPSISTALPRLLL